MGKQFHEHPSIPFLKSLYKNCDQGFINLRFLPSGKNYFLPLSGINSIPTLLATHDDQDAHFAVATRENKNGTKQGIIEIPALWIDLDIDPVSKPMQEKELFTVIPEFPLEPSFIILTGGGVHAYWRLKEPMHREDTQDVEDLLKRLAFYLKADMAATDASRILRIPGTFNFKYDPKREVSLWHFTENEYNPSDFDFLPEVETRPQSERATHDKSWERGLLEGVPQGERNTAITRLAGRYLEKGLSKEEVLPILFEVNARNKPPLTEREVEKIIDSVIKTHSRNTPPEAGAETREKQRVNYQLTTLREVFDYPEPTYLIDPILIEGTVSVLGAYTGTGKSITALSIVKSILTGELLWERYPVAKTGPVLIVDEETPRSFLRERTTKMGFTSDLPLYFLHFQDVRLDRDECFNALMSKIEEVSPVLLVIDSLVRVHRQKEDDAVAMSLVVGRLRKIANSGITLMVIHHHRKGEGPLSQKLRGSSDIPGGVDIEYALLPKDDHLIFTSVKTRTRPLAPIKLTMDVSNDHIGLTYQGSEIGEQEEVLQEVVTILRENGEKGVEDIFESLKDRGLKVGINRLREILRKADGKEFLERSGPKGKRLYKVNPAS